MFEAGSPQLGVEANDELVGIVLNIDVTGMLHLCGHMKQDDSVLEKSVPNRLINRLWPKFQKHH